MFKFHVISLENAEIYLGKDLKPWIAFHSENRRFLWNKNDVIHISLASFLWDMCKQQRTRPDAA